MLYLTAFWFLLPVIGPVAGGLALLPVITAGMLCGKRGALLSFLAVFFLGTSLLVLRGYDLRVSNNLLIIIAGNLFLLTSAIGVGWTSSLLQRIRQKKEALNEERNQMAAEIEKRKEIESSLRKQQEFNDNLQQGLALLSANLDQETIHERILEQLRKFIECDSISIMLYEAGYLVLRANLGHPDQEEIIGRKIPVHASNQNPGVRVFLGKKPIMIEDVSREPGWIKFASGEDIRSWIGIPLLVSDRAIGIMNIDSYSPQMYKEDDLQLMQAFARPVALILENNRLFGQAQMEIEERRRTAKRLEQRLQSEAMIASFTTQLIHTDLHTIDENILAILAELGKFTGADRCYLTILAADKVSFANDFMWRNEFVAPRAENEEMTNIGHLDWFYQKLLRAETIQINDIQLLGEEALKEKEHCRKLGIQSLLLIPIMHREELMGFLGFQTETKQMDWLEDDILSLQIMANIFSSFWSRREAEKQQQENLLLVQGILDSIPTPIFYIDTKGTYLGCNQEFSQSYGIEKEKLIGHNAYDFNPKERADYLMGIDLDLMERAESGTYEEPGTFADGSRHIMVAHKAPFFDLEGNVAGLIGVMMDITPQKTLENDLKQERASLAEKVEQQTRELRIANEELARAAKAKDEFLAAMSHELRTPLNAILGLSEAMQEEIYGPLTEKQEYTLLRIQESGKHLLALISDILDLAKIGANRLELEIAPVDVHQLCQSSLDIIQESAQKKRLSVHINLDPQVKLLQGDGRRLKQVLLNLLNNAVKFTPEGGNVFLEMEGDPQAGVVRFHIRDSGIGITEENLQTIFTPFQQVDSSLSRQYEGAGLGLALAAEMVKIHGGTLTVESIPRQGSHFCVSLPWTPKMNAVGFNHPAAQRSAHAPVQLPDPLTAPLILVAEDNPSNLEVLTDYLESKGYHLANALNGREAIQKTLELKPDLILMDIQMPEMDGLQAIRRIRQEASPASIPIIALTALAMPGDRERCLEAGANGYLVKPVHLKEMLGLISSLLQDAKEEKRD